MKTHLLFLPLVSLSLAFSSFAYADTDAGEVEALEKRIAALEKRIAALEASRSFASFMPDFAERFHVMHRAGEVGDWAVAGHELAELKRMTKLSSDIDAERGQLMQSMMSSSFEHLEEAIEHGSGEKFQKALKETVTTCNTCHTAAGASFVKVTLDAPDSLNMRHPHDLQKQKMPGGHMHSH